MEWRNCQQHQHNSLDRQSNSGESCSPMSMADLIRRDLEARRISAIDMEWMDDQQQQHDFSNYGESHSYNNYDYGGMGYAPQPIYQNNSYTPSYNNEWDQPQNFGAQNYWENHNYPRNDEAQGEDLYSSLNRRLDRIATQIASSAEHEDTPAFRYEPAAMSYQHYGPTQDAYIENQWQGQDQLNQYPYQPAQHQLESTPVSSPLDDVFTRMLEDMNRSVEELRLAVERTTERLNETIDQRDQMMNTTKEVDIRKTMGVDQQAAEENSRLEDVFEDEKEDEGLENVSVEAPESENLDFLQENLTIQNIEDNYGTYSPTPTLDDFSVLSPSSPKLPTPHTTIEEEIFTINLNFVKPSSLNLNAKFVVTKKDLGIVDDLLSAPFYDRFYSFIHADLGVRTYINHTTHSAANPAHRGLSDLLSKLYFSLSLSTYDLCRETQRLALLWYNYP